MYYITVDEEWLRAIVSGMKILHQKARLVKLAEISPLISPESPTRPKSVRARFFGSEKSREWSGNITPLPKYSEVEKNEPLHILGTWDFLGERSAEISAQCHRASFLK